MTNTTATEFTFEMMVEAQLHTLAVREAATLEDIAKSTKVGDFDYLARHLLRGAVRLQFRKSVLTRLDEQGREALVSSLAYGLNESGRSTDTFSNGAAEARREEALSLLREFRSFMTADEALSLVSKLY